MMEILAGSDHSIDPPPLGPLLYQQYEDQSSLCDVVIKTGLWEKRFHWCVLVASPFFDNIHRNNFLEKQTGIIQLNKWPASELEMALSFLYGRTPEITDENLEILLDLAEFLLIPALKMRCFKYLERTTVTLDNCVRLYELSCTYGFFLEDCDDFIRGKLPEVLEQEQMLNITHESLKVLLADQTLSYVSVKTWFRFLVQWAQKTAEREDMFVELLGMLDFNACNKDFLDTTIAKEPLIKIAVEDVKEKLMAVKADHNDPFLIFSYRARELKCLNMRTMLWYRICSSIDEYPFRYIAGVKSPSSSCIYKVLIGNDNGLVCVLAYDLNNAQYKIHSIATAVSNESDHQAVENDGDKDSVDDCFEISSYTVGNDTLTAVSRTQRKTNEQSECPPNNPFGPYIDRTRYTLHIVKLDEPVLKLHPILTLKDHSIGELVRSNTGTVAMLTSFEDKLFIYNEATCELDCIKLINDHGIEMLADLHSIAAFKDDFVLHDYDDTVVCVLKLSGASLDKKYLVKEIQLEKTDGPYEHKYWFAGDGWFRLSFKEFFKLEVMEYVSHNELVRTENIASLCWKKIPIPPDVNIGRTSYMDLTVFSVSLSKEASRCHLKCPHCRMAKHDQGVSAADTDDDDDDHDDDQYLYSDYSPGGSSFDDPYHVDSDNFDDFL